jgi:hypothetical protein
MFMVLIKKDWREGKKNKSDGNQPTKGIWLHLKNEAGRN